MNSNNEVMSSISDALGMNPLVLESEQEVSELEQSFPMVLAETPEAPVQTQAEKDAEEDFEFSREGLKKILESGAQALEDLSRLSRASEQPRSFEVISKLVKDLSEAHGTLLKLHEQRRQLAPLPEPEKKEKEERQEQRADQFVGTMAEILAIIKAEKKLLPVEIIDVEVSEHGNT
jgi:hypothetical protein